METTVSEIRISNRAADRIREIQREQNVPEGSLLRISVRSGGCSGLTYDLDFDPGTKVGENEHHFEEIGISIVVDMRSYLYLAGSELDYTDGLTGKGFHFENPNAARSCSCGESFSL